MSNKPSVQDCVLEVKDLRVEFPGQKRAAVNGVSFTLQRGQTLGLVGESGSGKSVTCLALMQLVLPPGKITTGQAWFHRHSEQSVNLLQLKAKELPIYRGQALGMVFQEPLSSLNPVFNCGFQVQEVLQYHQKLSPRVARNQAIQLLQEVQLIPSDAVLEEQFFREWEQRYGQVIKPTTTEILEAINTQKQTWLRRYPHQLSGGQIQRVMIAIALAANPEILIADEPTTALDVTIQATILKLLKDLIQKRQMSMMFVTHDLGIVADLADEIAVMYQGEIVEMGPTTRIFEHPHHPYTRGLLACRPRLDLRLAKLPTLQDFLEQDGMDSRQNSTIIPEATQLERVEQLQTQSPLLTVENLRVMFPLPTLWGQPKRYLHAVNNVSLQLYPGETLGLVGESGSGKTTLGRSLLGLVPVTMGRIEFKGQDITNCSHQQLRQIRQRMQIIFQDPYSALDPRLTIGASIAEPLGIHRKFSSKQRQDRVAYLLERVGLEPGLVHRYPHECSGGQRQRICIARALALQPELIICDESVSALDVSVQAQVLNLLKELQAEFNLTYIFISHDLNVVKFMSDRIMVMYRGKIEEIAPAVTLYQHPQSDYTRQLIAAIPEMKL